MKRVRVVIDGKVVQEVDVDRELIIGRSADVDIQIADGEVSSRHAKLRPSGDELYIMDLGSTNGTAIADGGDGERISANKQVAFERGMKIVLGPAILEVVPSAVANIDAEMENNATVVVGGGEQQALLVNIARFKASNPRLVIGAEHERRVVPIEEMEVSVGRDQSKADIIITHDSVSSKHAKLSFVNGRFMLHDLGSSNGTFLDGNPVAAPTPIPAEAAITFGTIDCLFVQKEPDQGSAGAAMSEALVNHTVRLGKATQQQAKDVLAEHRQSGRSLGEMFVERGILSPKDWAEIYRQRQIIGTLAPAESGGGGSSMKWIVILVIVAALAAIGLKLFKVI